MDASSPSLVNLVVGRPAVLLLNDTCDQDNWGSQALIHSLRAILEDVLPAARLTSIPSHWLLDPALVARNDAPAPRLTTPHVADHFESLADLWCRGMGGPEADQILRRLRTADVVVYNGEGSVYRQNHSAVRALFVLWLAKTRLGIPSLFLNGTVHLTRVDPILPAMVRKTFSCLDATAVREPCSWRNLAEHAPAVRVTVVPDSAFALSRLAVSEARVSAPVPGAGVTGAYFCYSPGMMRPDYEFGARSMLPRLIGTLRTLVPHVVLIARSPEDGFLERVAKETGAIYWGSGRNYIDLMRLLEQAAFLLSGRYHHLILAALVGCPAVAFAAASHKIHGLCELLDDAYGHPYDAGDIGGALGEIVDRCASYVRQRRTLGERIASSAARLGEASRGLGPLVQQALAER